MFNCLVPKDNLELLHCKKPGEKLIPKAGEVKPFGVSQIFRLKWFEVQAKTLFNFFFLNQTVRTLKRIEIGINSKKLV